MMIKANGEYLDYNGDIEIESRIKLFEEIGTSNGDFSYDIEIQDNGHNRKILGIPRADTVKSIYREVISEIIDDTGQSIYLGKLQVNRISRGIITTTFFAGNTEWFSELSEPLSALPLYKYDIDLTVANIFASFSNDSGIVFPIIDTGALVTRSFANFKVEDFTGTFYVKTLFNEIFNPKGIKLEGDFLEDASYTKGIIATNTRSQDEVRNRSTYVSKTTAQNNISASTHITFEDDTTFPYFDGATNNFISDTYTADVKMRIKITFTLDINYDALTLVLAGITKNGSALLAYTVVNSVGSGNKQFTRAQTIDLEAGDTINVFVFSSGSGTADVIGGTFQATPTYIYKVFGVSSVPKWTQLEFVSNILRLFNVLPSYNPASKTLTLDLFNNIKNKEYVDISDEIETPTTDFTEFVSSFAKNNIFKYQESDNEDLREYNISNFINYGSGNLTIDNDYIENSKDIVESDFTSPITYLNGVFDMSMERINYVELEDIDDKDITSVTDSSGTPRFNMSNADDLFTAGDLVRIETLLDSYNGEWVVNTVTSTYITVNGLDFDASTTGSTTLLKHQFTTDDNVYIFVNVSNIEPISFFTTSGTSVLLEASTNSFNASLAYFNLLSNNTPINRVYKQSLSFGVVNNPLNYQVNLLQTYWPLFSRILNSPVMLPATGYLKKSTFEKVKSFLRPVMIRTEETTNLYYINRNKGYKGSERPCELELIKLN